MAKVAITQDYLQDIADAIRTKTGLSSTYYPSEMAQAILSISGSGGIIPTGTINITTNGTHNVTQYASANVQVPTSASPSLQSKSVTIIPSLSTQEQTVSADNGYDGLSSVNITTNPVATGAVQSPVATKGTVSNHSISITPSVSYSTGYVTGNTKTGTAVSVSASQLVSGTLSVTSNGTKDVTNYTSVNVNVPTGGGTTINNQTKTATPSESEQEITYDSGYTGLQKVTVGAISSTYVGSGITRRSSSNLTASGATVTAPAGYYAEAAIKSVSSMTLPTSAASSATSGYTSKATISRSTSDQYINIPTGYNSAGGYYKINATPNGSVTAPSSISGSSATVSTGTNTLTLTKTVSVTPNVTTVGYISAGTAGNSSVSLTASVTTKAAATITPGTSNQTIASGTYLTGTQTIRGDSNLVASNIKDGVSIFGVTGTYEGESGGGSGILVGTKTATPAAAGSSITFTGLLGEPTSFAIVSASDLATGASPFKVSGVVYDGTNVIGQTVTNTYNAQVTYDGTNFSKSYSNGTLTVTSSSAYFQANEYKLTYSYNGTTSDVHTSDVQVGSGATSITFTGLTDEPTYFSCIFKSNFSTSSGYQRVIMVVYDGTSTYGMEMDSSAKANTSHWSYTYNNGSLVISSNGTNAGGYFHQPGYYQLTYVISDGSGDTGIVTAPSTITGTAATVTTGTNTLTLTKTVSVTPDVTTPGYISRGTAGNSNVSLTASVTTKGAATITPTTTNQTIASGTYLTGTQTISGDANLVSSNIISGKSIFGVSGSVVLQSVYTGSSAPSSSTGVNGDIYIQS